MTKTLTNHLLHGARLFTLAAFFVLVFMPAGKALACDSGTGVFGIPPWHNYLPCDADGGVDNVSIQLNQIWLIGIAVFEAIVRIGAFVAFIFVIRGGFKYIMSQGNPEATSSARKTITSSIIGLVLLMMSSIIVSFFMNTLGPGADKANGLPEVAANTSIIGNVLNIVYGVAALVSVIYIVLGGIKFTTSTGEPAKTASARNTIIYAVAGLVVVLSAYLITDAVIGRVGG
jgi:hypothetical protein